MAEHRDIHQTQPSVRQGGERPAGTAKGRVRGIAAGTAVVLAGLLLTGCGGGATNAAPEHVSGTAEPVHGDTAKGGRPSPGGSGSPSASSGGGGAQTSPGAPKGSSGGGSSGASSHAPGEQGPGGTESCHTSGLKAAVGQNHPGAGQENFALTLTNTSGHTCTLRGYPGLAFVDGGGRQVSVDPERTGGSNGTVTLAPGASAWAALSFTNPSMTDVQTVTPDAVRITPPDETAALKVPWSGGPVTRTGKASVPKVGAFQAGTGG